MTDPAKPPTTRHLSSFHVELLRLGQASPSDRAWIDGHLQVCPACAEMTDTFNASRRELADALAARPGAASRMKLERARRRRRFTWFGAGLLIPVAAGLIIFANVQRRPPPAADVPTDEAEVTAKGGPEFILAARRGSRVFTVQAGEPLRSGDQIRFVLERVRHPYLMIASVDGSGRANIYVPYEGSTSLAIKPDERIELPGSIIIDESPGPERLFAFLSRKPIDADKVRARLTSLGSRGAAAIRSTTALDVGAAEQVSMLVEKERR